MGEGSWHTGALLRPFLLDLVNPVGSPPFDHAPLAAPPAHLQSHRVALAPRSKHPHRIVARQIPPSADHLLALHPHRSPIQPDLRPDPSRVRPQTPQPHRHARRVALVAIHPRSPVQIVHHHVQVPVPVQITQTHPVRYALGVKSPFVAHIFKRQIASIAKSHI